eukprot:534416-Amphidinium_carterae.1
MILGCFGGAGVSRFRALSLREKCTELTMLPSMELNHQHKPAGRSWLSHPNEGQPTTQSRSTLS